MNSTIHRSAGVDRSHDRSVTEKAAFILGHLVIVLFCVWLVCFEGLPIPGGLFGQDWMLSDIRRSYILLGCGFFYWVRHFLTLFYLLALKVEWAEVLGLLCFIALIYKKVLIEPEKNCIHISIDLRLI
jgi:protein-S-isoprenylcysteine O-methyltransferase Ste14